MEKKNNPLVSVIVPVYKVERYVHKCVDSLLAQTYSNFELILVDDGSPDRCPQICDEYAIRDSRVRVVHQKNGGVSRARQAGIDAAQGDYAIHADPDDWVETDMLAELVAKAQKDDADIVMFDYWEEMTGCNAKRVSHNLEPYPSTDQLLQLALFQQLPGSCWNKLVRRACYSKVGFFPSEICYGEDELYTIRLLLCCERISYLPKAFYHYRQDNAVSLSHKMTARMCRSKIAEIEEVEKLLPANDYDNFATMKTVALKIAIMTGCTDELWRYPELQQGLIEAGRRFRLFSPLSYCLSLALRGRPKLGYALYQSVMALMDVKAVIDRIFRNR